MTRTHALVYAADNPALDLGGTCGPTDQRGFPAPLDGPDADTNAECDAGAVEASSAVALVPENPPVVIPEGGGSFRFTFSVTNTRDQPVTTQAWTRATRPDGTLIPTRLGPATVMLGPGETVSQALVQPVGPGVMVGEWTYTGFVGTHPDGAVAASSFTGTKQGATARQTIGAEARGGWPAARYAESGAPVAVGDVWTATPDASAGATALPAVHALHEARPNPLASRTTLGYDLPVGGPARLVVYDVLGRTVAVLAEGTHKAGRHTVVFDARELPSGTYLVRLEAGEEVRTRRVAVVR